MINNGLSFLENNEGIDYNTAKTVYELFEQNVELTPDKIALVLRGHTMTYQELNQKSNQLARMLRAHSVKPNDIIGILANRSLEMFIAILGVLKAGAAYLPIDPEYPSDRIHYMLEDSNIKIMLTMEHLKHLISFNGETLTLDRNDLYYGDSSNLQKCNSINDLIYVIYTSGSTGLPKGTLIEHRSIINLIEGMSDKINFHRDKRILSLASFAFDMSMPEILIPLSKGMTIVIADDVQKNNPKYLNDCIIENKVDMLQITPSRLQLMFNYGKSIEFLNILTDIMVGAEPFPKALLETLKNHTPARIYNLYGPTETTVWSTIGDLTGSDTLHVGTPIQHTQIMILDQEDKLCPLGEEGELCILGDGLARGYLNRQTLTNEKFQQNPYLPDKRIYRTGDLARMDSNRTLEVIGRIDSQVKLNGRRIELGEIEYHLLKYDMIQQAAVIVKDNTLCAYVVSSSDILTSDVRKHLSNILPDYMIPTAYKRIDKMPLSFNGKVDKKTLLQLEQELNCQTMVAATCEDIDSIGLHTIQSRLRNVLSENVPNKQGALTISLDEPLTNIGLDSVSFVKLIVALELEFDVEFDDEYLDFKKLPTLSSMLSVIEHSLV
ncbi:hypothetical protein bsdtb5_00890 [Anaeromicropila herbilytica]|uniref:Carrier domain-containing protein n=2 Tax=Anaeromicropila herbilytica TaxID=2785025 RepID=A0A7R7EHE9_9FIRM|nr:hypothetical protein bsdtb5_00890 [Anaeromicropila herbilytica]